MEFLQGPWLMAPARGWWAVRRQREVTLTPAAWGPHWSYTVSAPLWFSDDTWLREPTFTWDRDEPQRQGFLVLWPVGTFSDQN